MADHKEFTGVTREKLESIRKDLSKRGIKIPKGDDVEVDGPFGVKMQVSYDETSKKLKLEINEKPIFISENQIWKIVESGAGGLGA